MPPSQDMQCSNTHNNITTIPPPQQQFSSQVQLALSSLSSRFGNEINGAFETMPATEERAKEDQALICNPDAAVEKMKVLKSNRVAISDDMELLYQSKVSGGPAHFQAFRRLGGDDYLEESSTLLDQDEDGSEVDSSSYDSDSSEDSSAFDDSDYDDSDCDSDESSIGSLDDLIDEMENDMGVVIPEDLRVRIFKPKSETCVVRGALFVRQLSDGSLVSIDSLR
jgi:hypothetical protein